MTRLPTYFLSHGGGPWPWIEGPFRAVFDQLEASLTELRDEIAGPVRAVLAISGHWEAPQFRVSSASHPPMVFDYYGFDDYLYHIRYDAPGSPVLAEHVRGLLARGSIDAALDGKQGFDHGTFSLMKALYPDATMPIVQLSLRADYDPETHLRVGRLLAPLRDEGVLIVGSGSSFHDLRTMNAHGTAPSRVFDAWLDETLVAADPAERDRRLRDWAQAPAARAAHPREDHLMPLMVAAGAADGDAATRIFHQDDFFGHVAMSSFRFGAPIAATADRIGEMA